MTMVNQIDKCCSGFVAVHGQAYRINLDKHDRRVAILKREYEQRDLFVLVPSNVWDGVDILVFNKNTGKLIEAVESTNYAVPEISSMKDDRVQRYIGHLNFYDALPDVRKKIVVSYRGNLYSKRVKRETLQRLEDSHIEVVVRGRQD